MLEVTYGDASPASVDAAVRPAEFGGHESVEKFRRLVVDARRSASVVASSQDEARSTAVEVGRVAAQVGISHVGLGARTTRQLAVHQSLVCDAIQPGCNKCVLISWCSEGKARRRLQADSTKPLAVDLFAGAGGLSLGLTQAGWRIALAVEADRDAAQTYRVNHPGVPVAELDVARTTHADLRALGVGDAAVQAVVAGPPCQGYSHAGRRRADDEKNQLFRHVTRLAAALGSQTVAIENVLGTRSVEGRAFADSILRSLRGRAYRAQAFDLNAIDFGVPQRRRRLIFVGVSADDRVPAIVAERGTETPTLEATLKDLPPFPSGTNAEFYVGPDGAPVWNGSTMRHSLAVIQKISEIPPGGGPISYRRLHLDAARTLIAGHRALPVHPWLDRTISVREAARIQGFPDTYVFCGSRSAQPLQVANAVPPALGASVGRALQVAISRA